MDPLTLFKLSMGPVADELEKSRAEIATLKAQLAAAEARAAAAAPTTYAAAATAAPLLPRGWAGRPPPSPPSDDGLSVASGPSPRDSSLDSLNFIFKGVFPYYMDNTWTLLRCMYYSNRSAISMSDIHHSEGDPLPHNTLQWKDGGFTIRVHIYRSLGERPKFLFATVVRMQPRREAKSGPSPVPVLPGRQLIQTFSRHSVIMEELEAVGGVEWARQFGYPVDA